MISRGMMRFVFFVIVCATFFVLSGGQLHIFWQPLDFLMVVGIYAVSMVGQRIKLYPFDASLENILKIQSAGLAGLAISMVVTVVLGLIQTAAYLTSGVETIGMLLAATLISLIYAVSVYFCFFSGLEALADGQVTHSTDSTHSRSANKFVVPLIAGGGALIAIVLFVVALVVIFHGGE